LVLSPIWGSRPDFYYCHTVAPSLTRGRVSRLQLLLVVASAAILWSESRGTYYHILLTQWARFPYLFPRGTRWTSYSPRHWVPFSSPPTTRRAAVELFEPAFTRVSKTEFLQNNINIQFIPHRKHITSPLQSPTG
jgi:hypothetical protein